MAIGALVFVSPIVLAQETPKPARGEKAHEWLKQMVGEWESDIGKGGMTARMMGEIWLVGENNVSFGDTKISAMLTLGYDPAKKKYVGTWVDSMFNYLWKYEGAIEGGGKTLTLEAEGPDLTNPANANKLVKYRDAWEIKTKDHMVLTSSAQGPDGKWSTFMTANFKRKK